MVYGSEGGDGQGQQGALRGSRHGVEEASQDGGVARVGERERANEEAMMNSPRFADKEKKNQESNRRWSMDAREHLEEAHNSSGDDGDVSDARKRRDCATSPRCFPFSSTSCYLPPTSDSIAASAIPPTAPAAPAAHISFPSTASFARER